MRRTLSLLPLVVILAFGGVPRGLARTPVGPDCVSDVDVCLAGVRIQCPAGASAGGGTISCAATLPADPRAVSLFEVRLRGPEGQDRGLQSLVEKGAHPASTRLTLELPVPGSGEIGRVYHTRVGIRWRVEDEEYQEYQEWTSLAHLLRIHDLVVTVPERVVAGARTGVVVTGAEVEHATDLRISCVTGDEKATLPVIEASVPEGGPGPGATRMGRVLAFDPPALDRLGSVLTCRLRGRIRGWDAELPFSMKVDRRATRPIIWPEKALAREEQDLDVFFARPDPSSRTLHALPTGPLGAAWGGTVETPPSERLWSEGAFEVRRFKVPARGDEPSELFQISLPDEPEVKPLDLWLAPETVPISVLRGEISPRVFTREEFVKIRLERKDFRSGLSPDARSTFVLYVAGLDWVVTGMAMDLTEIGEHLWSFQRTLLEDDRIGPVARMLAIFYMKIEGKVVVAGYDDAVFAERAFRVELSPTPAAVVADGRQGYVALVTWADGRPLKDGTVALRGVDGTDRACKRVDGLSWACMGPPPMGGGMPGVVVTSGSREGEIYPQERPPGPPSRRPGTMTIRRALLHTGDPLEVDLAATDPDAILRPDPYDLERAGHCFRRVQLSAWVLGREPSLAEVCLKGPGATERVIWRDLTDLSGPIEVRATWFNPHGAMEETVARAFVGLPSGPEAVRAELASKTQVAVELDDTAAEADQMLVWLSDRMDPEPWGFRADQMAAAALGVLPPEGHTVWSAPLEHPAGVLSRLVEGKSEVEARMGLRDGHDQLVRPWARSSHGLASALTLEKGMAYALDARRSLERVALRWKTVWSQQENGACLDPQTIDGLVAEQLGEMLAERAEVPVSMAPYPVMLGTGGLWLDWLGPDGRLGTPDDRLTAFSLPCGPENATGESSILEVPGEPPRTQWAFRSTRIVRTDARHVWLQAGYQEPGHRWVSPELHPGSWWVHAVGFKAGRLHFAAVRRVELPFPRTEYRDTLEDGGGADGGGADTGAADAGGPPRDAGSAPSDGGAGD